MARPEHQYSEIIAAKLHSLLCFGIPQKKIANHIGLSFDTMKKHYSEILENTIPDRDSAVEHSLFYQATVLNIPTSTIFYLKTRMPERYGDQKADDNQNVKDDILSHIASKLPD